MNEWEKLAEVSRYADKMRERERRSICLGLKEGLSLSLISVVEVAEELERIIGDG